MLAAARPARIIAPAMHDAPPISAKKRVPPGAEAALGPLEAFDRWPGGRALAAMVSVDGHRGAAAAAWARTSMLTTPGAATVRSASEARAALDPLGECRAAIESPSHHGVIGAFSYELGRILEPAAECSGRDFGAEPDRAHPAMTLHRAAGCIAFDGVTGAASQWGDVPELASTPHHAEFAVGAFASTTGAAAYQRAVARAVEYIHAGDCFQVNLAHRLSARFRGSVRSLASRLFRAVGPALGAYIEVPRADGSVGSVIVSVSPELFLRFDARSRTVTTRPIKGTRSAAEHASALESSHKDAAELAMIVDLMRNDLGRTCEPASIRVDRPRDTEVFGRDPDSAVRHTVATVSGTVPRDRSVIDVMAAAFPPGSVTGAPKIRAMQIIDELEPVGRGPYCGAIAWFAPTGDATLSVPIRTAVVHLDPGSTPTDATGVIDLHVGAGIVADSDPRAEWIETLHKAGTILAPLGQDAMMVDR